MKKYELIKETETIFMGREVFRVKALKNFGNVKAGDVGGWVCSENNLSQEGDCWIYDDAKCLDNAKMFDNAVMFGNAKMFDNARILNNSIMCDNAKILNNSIMCDNAKISGNARMSGNSMMFDNAYMFEKARLINNSIMYNNARILNNSIMCDNARMYDYAIMSGNSRMSGNSVMYGNAILNKDKLLYGSINESYKKIFQYYCEKRLLTAILTEENEILYSVGCQVGMTKEKFIYRIYNDCNVEGKGLEEYPHRQEYLDIIGVAESYLKKFI